MESVQRGKNFTSEILQIVDDVDTLAEIEQRFLDELKPTYNTALIAIHASNGTKRTKYEDQARESADHQRKQGESPSLPELIKKMLIRTEDNTIYVPVRLICVELGLSVDGQKTRLNTDDDFADGLVELRLPPPGGPQKTLCIAKESLPGGL